MDGFLLVALLAANAVLIVVIARQRRAAERRRLIIQSYAGTGMVPCNSCGAAISRTVEECWKCKTPTADSIAAVDIAG